MPGRDRDPEHVDERAGVPVGEPPCEPQHDGSQHRYRRDDPPERHESTGVLGRRGARDHDAVDVLRAEPRTDPDRIAAVGYGTGGAIALELGRDGADLRAIATVNGLTTGRPGEAAAALRSVTRAGGHVAATIWCGPAGAGHELLHRAVAEAGAQQPADLPRLAAADDFPRTADGFTALFEGAGLTGVTCVPVGWDHLADPEEWGGGAEAGVGLIGQTISRQEPQTIRRIRSAYDRLVPEYAGPDGRLVLRYHALLATGRA